MHKTVKRILVFVLVAAILGGGIYGGLTYWKKSRKKAVDVYPVADFAMTEYWGDNSEAYGIVTADQLQKVYLSDTQTITEFYVDEGQEVRIGEALFSYDTTLSEIDVRKAEIEVERLNLQLNQARRDLDYVSRLQPYSSTVIYPPEVVPEYIPSPTPQIISGLGSESDPLYVLFGEEDELDDELIDALFERRMGEIKKAGGQVPAASLWNRSDAYASSSASFGTFLADFAASGSPIYASHAFGGYPVKVSFFVAGENEDPSVPPVEPPASSEPPVEPPASSETPPEPPVSSEVPEEPSASESPSPEPPPSSAAPSASSADPFPSSPEESSPEESSPENPSSEDPSEPSNPSSENPSDPSDQPSDPSGESSAEDPSDSSAEDPSDEPSEESSEEESSPEDSSEENNPEENPYNGYSEEDLNPECLYVGFAIKENNALNGPLLYSFGLRIRKTGRGTYAFKFYDPILPEDAYGYVDMPEPIFIESGSMYSAAEIAEMRSSCEEKIKNREGQMKMAQVDLQRKRQELSDGKVFSTIEGLVRFIRDPGECRETNEAVIEVSHGGGYYIDVAMSELELGTVSVGQTVQVQGFESGTFCEGSIVAISDYPTDHADSWSDGNSNVSYFPFTVFVDEDEPLMEGEYSCVTYQNAELSAESLYLENEFIRSEGGKSYVLLDHDGVLEKRMIQTGRSLWGSYTEIRGGLTIDDYVAFPYGQYTVEGAETNPADAQSFYESMDD